MPDDAIHTQEVCFVCFAFSEYRANQHHCSDTINQLPRTTRRLSLNHLHGTNHYLFEQDKRTTKTKSNFSKVHYMPYVSWSLTSFHMKVEIMTFPITRK